jgi:hypothetical protein
MQKIRRHRLDFWFAISGCGPVFRLLPFLLALSACLTDAELLAENSRIALQTAEKRAARDLSCSEAKAVIVSEQEVPGQPLGELYSDYGIRVDGCGRAVSYDVECRDERICFIREKPTIE